MLLGWPKWMGAGWTTPIDARRLDGRVRQTDGAQPYFLGSLCTSATQLLQVAFTFSAYVAELVLTISWYQGLAVKLITLFGLWIVVHWFGKLLSLFRIVFCSPYVTYMVMCIYSLSVFLFGTCLSGGELGQLHPIPMQSHIHCACTGLHCLQHNPLGLCTFIARAPLGWLFWRLIASYPPYSQIQNSFSTSL